MPDGSRGSIRQTAHCPPELCGHPGRRPAAVAAFQRGVSRAAGPVPTKRPLHSGGDRHLAGPAFTAVRRTRGCHRPLLSRDLSPSEVGRRPGAVVGGHGRSSHTDETGSTGRSASIRLRSIAGQLHPVPHQRFDGSRPAFPVDLAGTARAIGRSLPLPLLVRTGAGGAVSLSRWEIDRSRTATAPPFLAVQPRRQPDNVQCLSPERSQCSSLPRRDEAFRRQLAARLPLDGGPAGALRPAGRRAASPALGDPCRRERVAPPAPGTPQRVRHDGE